MWDVLRKMADPKAKQIIDLKQGDDDGDADPDPDADTDTHTEYNYYFYKSRYC